MVTTISGELSGQRVLITSADCYMGPSIAKRFRDEGAVVIEDFGPYENDPEAPAHIIARALPLDVLVINLHPGEISREPVFDASEDEWQKVFNRLVHPTMRFSKAVLPHMIERRSGKIIAVTSGSSIRPRPDLSAYCSARGAQNTYIRCAGSEVARYNVQVNAIAQSFVEGGWPRNAMSDPAVREMVLREVPAQRLGTDSEQAELALFLASNRSNFMCGQVIPFAGGWT
jgi:2-keto-3-deoxy-L-fuconate dehydrogenase